MAQTLAESFLADLDELSDEEPEQEAEDEAGEDDQVSDTMPMCLLRCLHVLDFCMHAACMLHESCS